MANVSNNDIARAAWDAVKGPDDAPWDAIRNKSHKDKLIAEVEAYQKSGPSATLDKQSPFVQVMSKLMQDREQETAKEIDSLADKARATLKSGHVTHADEKEPEITDENRIALDLPLPADEPRGVPVSATEAVPAKTDEQGRTEPEVAAKATETKAPQRAKLNRRARPRNKSHKVHLGTKENTK